MGVISCADVRPVSRGILLPEVQKARPDSCQRNKASGSEKLGPVSQGMLWWIVARGSGQPVSET